MSSREYKYVQRTAHRINQISPNQNINQNQTTIKNLGSIKTRGQLEIQTAQPASTFVSRRELIQNSLADTKDLNQLPVRSNDNNFGRVDRNEQRVFKYEYKTNNRGDLDSRINTKEISSVGKNDNQRYKSSEQQNIFQRRYEMSESPIKRNVRPLAIGTRGNFNMRKWAYAPTQDINKITTLQRWWRYLLKNNIRLSRYSDNSSKNRSKSSQYPKKGDVDSLMKTGENITEQVFPGQKRVIVETRKVEVFKPNKPIQDNQIMAESKVSYSKSLNETQKYSQSIREDNYPEKSYPRRYHTLYNEIRKPEVFKNPRTTETDNKYIKETEKYGESIKKSREIIYDGIGKKGENITEQIRPGEKNKLIVETKKVEVYKNKRSHIRQGLAIDTKDSKRYDDTIDEYDDELEGEEMPGRKRRYHKFIERDGITKAFIKDKMAQIWMNEIRKVSEIKFSIINRGQTRDISFGTRNRNLSPDKKGGITRDNLDDITTLLHIIKEKDIELNKLVNQLKSQVEPKHKIYDKYDKYDSHTTGKIGLLGNRNVSTDDYESKIRQLIRIIEDKDYYVNQLINQFSNNNGISGYDIVNRTFDDKSQRNESTYSQFKKQIFIKNTIDSTKRTFDADTFKTQGSILTEKEDFLNNKNITRYKESTNSTNGVETRKEFSELDFDKIGLEVLTVPKEHWNDIVKECPINSLFIKDIKDEEEKPENEMEARDSVEICGLEKEPLIRQLIDALIVFGFEKNDNEYERVQEIEILRTKRPAHIISQRDSVEIIGLEKVPLEKQGINQLTILEQIPENIYQRTQELEILRSTRTSFAGNEIVAKDSVEIHGLEKEEFTPQLINSLLIMGYNLEDNEIEKTNEIEIRRTLSEDIIMELRDSVEIIGLEKAPLQQQGINQLTILAVEKDENQIEKTQEIEILRTQRQENIVELRDTVQIMGLEKEPLQQQGINQLTIYSLDKEENQIENTEQVEILRVEKPLNEIETIIGVELIGLEKQPLVKQLINELFIYEIKDENECQRTEEFELFPVPKPENIIVLRDSIEILGIEKQPLQSQLINELIISEDKPENEYQLVSEFTIFKTEKPENKIEEIHSIEINGLEKQELITQLIEELNIAGIEKPENEYQMTNEITLLEKERIENQIEEVYNIEISALEKQELITQLI